ncbi:hypothetical protein C725_0386 [Pacificimonas flava]|uniref:Uncharacterized protein n=1 Tax=Pacificimonas flava TaxID=1234595 RepID=M2TRP9_9SPHN|nr:hypothetical protein C725_0386 [Pacificimonas flava]
MTHIQVLDLLAVSEEPLGVLPVPKSMMAGLESKGSRRHRRGGA